MVDTSYIHNTYIVDKADVNYVDQEDTKIWNAISELGGGEAVEYALQLDEDGDITYIGEAAIGSLSEDAVWRIKRIDESGDPEIIIKWADGNENFDNVFDNRAAYTYT